MWAWSDHNSRFHRYWKFEIQSNRSEWCKTFLMSHENRTLKAFSLSICYLFIHVLLHSWIHVRCTGPQRSINSFPSSSSCWAFGRTRRICWMYWFDFCHGSLINIRIRVFITRPSLLSYIHTRQPTNPRPMPTNFHGLVGYDRVKIARSDWKAYLSPINTRCIRAVSLMHPRSNPTLPDLPPVLPADQSPLCTTNPDLFLVQLRSLRSI